MQNKKDYPSFDSGCNSAIIEHTAMLVVVYSVEFDFSVEMKSGILCSGRPHFFSCLSDTPADIKQDIVADLVQRLDCFDDDGNELPVSLAGVKEKSIKIVFQHLLNL